MVLWCVTSVVENKQSVRLRTNDLLLYSEFNPWGKERVVWTERLVLTYTRSVCVCVCVCVHMCTKSLQFSCSVVSDSLRPHESQHARPPCPSPTPGVYSNPCPSSQWTHPAISSSVVPFSSCPQSPPSGSFPMSQLFTSGGQCISASASVLPMNILDWSPLGWTGWISFQSKGLSRVFSNTTVQKHQFFMLSFLHSPTLTSIHDHQKNHSLD